MIVLHAPSNDIDTLKQMMEAVTGALITLSAGEVVVLEFAATGDDGARR